MSIKANINTDSHGNIIFHMQGRLTFEINLPFRQELMSLLDQFPSSLVTLDFQQIDFVGSSGIGIFVETINLVNKEKIRVKLINVQEEFTKVFKLYGLLHLNEILETWSEDFLSNVHSEDHFINKELYKIKQG